MYGFLRNETETFFEEKSLNETFLEDLEKNWPWIAYLHIASKNSEDYFCNGVIIHPRWVLIPGSCATTEFSHGEAQLGGTDRENLVNFEISQVHRHENFSTFFINNIALVQLKDLIPFGPEQSPICIYKDYGNTSSNEIFVAAGWGLDLEIAKDDTVGNDTIERDIILDEDSKNVLFKESNILRERMLMKSDDVEECINFREKLTTRNSKDYICTHGVNNQSFKFEKGASLMLLKNREWILVGLLSEVEIRTIQDNRFDTVDTSNVVHSDRELLWLDPQDNLGRSGVPILKCIGLKYSKIFNADVNNEKRILGGDVAEEKDWPWLVVFEYIHDSGIFACTGSIIHEHWILVAAHCVNGGESRPESFLVRYGSTNITKAKVVRVAEVFTHAHFAPITVSNDITLVKISENLEFDEFVSPICLEENTTFESDQIFVGAGWGTVFEYIQIDKGNDTIVESLDELSRTVPDVAEERMMQLREPLENQTLINCVEKICVGGLNSGGLPGDSGGPLMLLKDGRWVKVGIASAIHGLHNLPENRIDLLEITTYVRVSSYCNWIREKTGGEVECK
ncbi:hypothetical protein FO519_007365 [Halicephalobus sp. NKZ332]|nr:hypothetical protein FO519_007365 [Halicephalobus sp. NKZ332]